MAPGGLFGRALVIDVQGRVATGTSFALDEGVLRDFLGGVGLGTWLCGSRRPGRPAGAGGPLVFAFSPLVGSPLTTSAKFAVVGQSPLTGRLCDALASAGSPSPASGPGSTRSRSGGVRRALGAVHRRRPSVAARTGAGELWGLSAARGRGGRASRFGPTGRSRRSARPASAACVRDDQPRRPARRPRRARGGARVRRTIKAIAGAAATAVRAGRPGGDRRAGPRPARARRSARRPRSTASWGRVANLLDLQPVRHAADPQLPAGRRSTRGRRLAAEDLHERASVAAQRCAACTIGCEHIYARKRRRQRCGWSTRRCSPSARSAASTTRTTCSPRRGLRRAGIDTISRRRHDRLRDGVRRARADRRAVAAVRRRRGAAARRSTLIGGPRAEGLGELLALGSRPRRRAGRPRLDRVRAARQGAGDARLRAPCLQTMALGLAVGTRGADHNRSGAYEADFSGEVDRATAAPPPSRPRSRPRTAPPDGFADPLQVPPRRLRRSVRRVGRDAAAVTGWDVDADELRGPPSGS